MNHLEIFEKLRQDTADSIVDSLGPQTAANDHDHRLFGGKAGKGAAFIRVTLQQFGTDGCTRHHSLALRQMSFGFRKITAHLHGRGNAKLIGQTGGHIRFMDDGRDL